MRRFKTAVAISVAMLTVGSLAACADQGAPVETDDQIVVARAAEVTTLDADAVASSREGWETLGLIADSLFAVDAGGSIVPRLAEGYEFSDDNTVLTVTLRKDVVFSNGTPLTAADVAFTIENAQKGELQGALFANIVEIGQPDDHTIELHYANPSSSSVMDLSSYAVAVIPENFGGVEATAFWLDPVTVGPFMVDSWEQGIGITLKRNDSYYGEAPKVESIKFLAVPDENTRLLQLQNGTVDLIDSVTTAQVGQIESGAGLSVVEFAAGQNVFLTLNSTIAPFDNEAARRAVSLAIDRESVVQAALGGYGEVGGSFVVSSAAGGFSPPFGSKFDLDAARAELAAAGLSDGFEFEIMYAGGASAVDTAMQVIQQNLAEIGVTVTLAGLDNDVIGAKVGANDWNVYVANIIVDTDAGGVLQYYGATNGFYAGHQQTMDEMQSYFEQANNDFSGQDARNAIFQKALDVIAERALQIAVYDPARLWGASDKVAGLVALNTTGAIDFLKIHRP